ncbi:hypothetical protein [Symbioplanes lichenis]|uniref:hypothetical protein n=1 Tax=Symbioplanes lichenis TaxID=1629072 RepID=UPI0027385AA6|nr:hypothetical protein [Actinoplanes lichenis]
MSDHAVDHGDLHKGGRQTRSGAVSGYQLPLPTDWRLPVRHRVAGYTIRPQSEDSSVEVLYEFPVPGATSRIEGITVRYRAGGIAYRKTFDVAITICAPAGPRPCG